MFLYSGRKGRKILIRTCTSITSLIYFEYFLSSNCKECHRQTRSKPEFLVLDANHLPFCGWTKQSRNCKQNPGVLFWQFDKRDKWRHPTKTDHILNGSFFHGRDTPYFKPSQGTTPRVPISLLLSWTIQFRNHYDGHEHLDLWRRFMNFY